MEIDFVQLSARDGVLLVGALFPPERDAVGHVDAIVLCPGTSAEFFSPPLPTVAAAAAAAGYAALTLSTRGRGIVWRDRQTGFQGAAFERISDCVEDFAGAIDWLRERGYRRVVLWGHSLSGVKVLYAAAHAPHPSLVGVISVAGPRWSAEHYRSLPVAAEFERHRQTAERMVADGRGGDLFPVTFPLGPTFQTAEGWLDKYAHEKYNPLRWADQIALPFCRIDAEGDLAVAQYGMAGLAEQLLRRAQPTPFNRAVVIPKTDHLFTGAHEQLAKAVVDWLDALRAPADALN
jgi:alpha-beta hydrolase superfamily lysophospholipase